MSSIEEEVWQRAEAPIYAGTHEKSNEVYTTWASKYDEDLVEKLGLLGPTVLAKLMMSYVSNSESAKILDLAAGTGLVGEQLRKWGFEGIMDAVDINEAMLEKAKQKKIYRKHICAGVTQEFLPVDEGSYDGVICGGGVARFHIEAEGLVAMVHCLKPGGFLIFNTRNNNVSQDFKATIDRKLDDMVLSGQLEETEKKSLSQFEADKDLSPHEKEKRDPSPSQYYVYKKL